MREQVVHRGQTEPLVQLEDLVPQVLRVFHQQLGLLVLQELVVHQVLLERVELTEQVVSQELLEHQD